LHPGALGDFHTAAALTVQVEIQYSLSRGSARQFGVAAASQ
jgi:hypothetical protein